MKRDYSRHSSVTQMMNELNWRPLHQRRKDKRLVLLYNIINNLVAIPPDKHFSLKNKAYSLRTKHSKQIESKSVNIDTFKYSFFPRTILEWNKLSSTEVDCQSVNQFKAALQKTI